MATKATAKSNQIQFADIQSMAQPFHLYQLQEKLPRCAAPKSLGTHYSMVRAPIKPTGRPPLLRATRLTFLSVGINVKEFYCGFQSGSMPQQNMTKSNSNLSNAESLTKIKDNILWYGNISHRVRRAIVSVVADWSFELVQL
jgi:hypothetical protein